MVVKKENEAYIKQDTSFKTDKTHQKGCKMAENERLSVHRSVQKQ